jgi:hypothetical protein
MNDYATRIRTITIILQYQICEKCINVRPGNMNEHEHERNTYVS